MGYLRLHVDPPGTFSHWDRRTPFMILRLILSLILSHLTNSWGWWDSY